ncbi:uncharacterized protein LOC126690039 [Quercus robur]|uniref:uncharacterized protein LOC126690039 n=1 Tax=Quercus robur TaxID=38942 RepID=UPI0021637A3B|nr:uncharacterized protein LOC126690039 [Quercus robur]
MSKALDRISQSPFTRRIEGAELPRRFHQPIFAIYNGRTDPVEHVSQFNQRMAVHSRDEALMCKVFPSSLGPMVIRGFDSLKPNSINSFKHLTQAFGSHFIEGNYDGIAISTFKKGLPTEHGLRKSLTGKLVTSVRQLMDRIDKYKRVKGDQQMGKGKAKVVPQERRDFRSDRFGNNNRLRRDYSEQSGSTGAQAVHTVFREPLHKILEKVKNEPFFQWPSRMAGDPAKRNQSLYCEYHQEPGHSTNDCRNLKNHLDRLVREGKMRHLLHHPIGRQEQAGVEARQSTLRPPIGTINVILAAPRRTRSHPFRVMSVAQLPIEVDDCESKRAKGMTSPILGFSDEDKVGTIQPHDDALVVTLRIGGYDVKRVLVDQGSAVEVMYPDWYKGLKLRPEDLIAYDSPLVSFKGKTVTPKGQIRLPIQTGSNIVEVDFIVVDAYSPYTAIVARPWFHTLGAVSSTLHQKVKYPLEG